MSCEHKNKTPYKTWVHICDDCGHLSVEKPGDESNRLEKLVIKGVSQPCAVADKYNYAILVLERMRLIFFEHKDELDVAKDTLLNNGKRLQYYKKDKNGYWIKPDVYE